MSAQRMEEIAGQSMLSVRRLLVEGIDEVWNEWLVRYVLNVDQEIAEQIIAELAARGYIERAAALPGEKVWEATIQGQAFAKVTKIKPIPRAGAERKLAELLAKIRTVSEESYYLYKVTRALVYGQFLTDDENISQLEIVVSLAPKESDARRQATLDEIRIREMREKGRVFPIRAKELPWPQQEILSFLEARSRIVKVAAAEHSDLKGSYLTLYEEG